VKTDYNEIDEGTGYIGFREAFDIIGANVRPVGDEALSLDLCVCRVAAADLVAMVSYHSVGVSLKDGFAVKSTDVVYADRRKPVCLKVAGSAFAGVKYEGQREKGFCLVTWGRQELFHHVRMGPGKDIAFVVRSS